VAVEDLSDAAFIERMEAAYDQNPLFRHKPENVARLYRIAGMPEVARQFDAFIERLSLPTLPWVCQQARGRLVGIEPGCHEAVMAERGMILAYLRDVRHSTIGEVAQQRLDEAIGMIERGEHRTLLGEPEPGKLIEEQDV